MRGRFILLLIMLACSVRAQKDFTDTLSTSQGELVIHVLGHASVRFEYKGLSVYVDPYGKVQDFAGMTKADLLLVTHADKDHFDTVAIGEIVKPETRIIFPQICADMHSYPGRDTILANGDSVVFFNLQMKAVPAYNPEKTKHPKGVGNGYVIQFGNKRVYISGDTELIPEMEDLKDIDLAFLPLSQPYDMTPEMMAETVGLIGPEILVPYHYDDADITPLLDILKDIPGLEVWTGESATHSGYRNSIPDSDLLIWPNPVYDFLFSDELTIHSDAFLYDISGRLILSGNCMINGFLDTGCLQKGHYILQIINKDRILTGTFLKQ
jgi:L-ascorbate metabolism protein UlaG (beta-lactamase superfamily)